MATPNIHLGESFLGRLIQDTYGKNSLGELSTEQMNELDAYIKSDDFKTKSQNFRSTDKTKFEGSVDHFLGKDTAKSKAYLQSLSNPDKTKYLIPRLTTTTPVTDRSNTHIAGTTVRPSVSGDSPETVIQEQPLTDQWLAVAKSNGFTSLDDVKAFQKKVGLDQTGQLDEPSLAKLAWYNHMKGLKYSENSLQDGQVSFFNDGKTYYNNGRMQSSNGTMSNYDYKTLSAPQPVVKPRQSVTKEQFLNNEYFRPHYTAGKTVTIDGKEYPIMVTQKLFNKKQYGLENDRTYALDPDTGLIRLVTENGFGMIAPLGGKPTFQHGSDWVDASGLIIPSYTSLAEFKQREAEWLKNNPKPDNEFLKRQWSNKHATARRAGFKLNGGPIKKQYFKQGGVMNRIKYFQQGGAAQQGAQDVQQQIKALVMAAMNEADPKHKDAIKAVNQIKAAADQGDPQAQQLATMIQQEVKQLQTQARAAKWGTKLGYIKSLKYAKGGKTCPTCEQGAPIKVEEKACGGKAKKAKKRYFGGWL